MLIETGNSERERAEADAHGLATARLWLRPLLVTDALDFAVLGGPREVASMTGHIPYPLTVGSAKDWIADLEVDGTQRSVMAILYRGQLIGVCGYAPERPNLHAIGYFIGTAYWGRGFATEAAGAIIARCFERTSSTGIAAHHFAENIASARVLRKLGFAPCAAGRSWCPVMRAERDTMAYVLTRQAFHERRAGGSAGKSIAGEPLS